MSRSILSLGYKKKLSKSRNSIDTHFLKIIEKIKLPDKRRELELTLLFTEDSVFFTTGSVVMK